MAFKTWEEAAEEAANLIASSGEGGAFDDLDDVDVFLDNYSPKLLCPGDFADLGAYALQTAHLHDSDAWDPILEILDTVIAKQHDYGHGNILRHGITGIVVRMCDKVARIRNLEKRQARMGADPLNEPLVDSWRDLVGYSIVAIMLLNGTFELPLARDLATEVFEPPLENGDPLSMYGERVTRLQTEGGQVYRWTNNRWVFGGSVPR